MFRSSQKLYVNIPCPGLQYPTGCSLPNCIFSHTIQTTKKRTSEISSTINEDIKRSKIIHNEEENESDDAYEPQLISKSQNKPENVEPKKSSILERYSYKLSTPPPSDQPKAKLAVPVETKIPEPLPLIEKKLPPAPGRKLASNASSKSVLTTTQSIPKIIQPPTKPLITVPTPAKSTEKTNKPPSQSTATTATTTATSTATSSTKPQSVQEKKDVQYLVPHPVKPFPPATPQQRLSYLQVIFSELQNKKVGLPKRIAMKLEYDVAKSSSKLLYPKNIRTLVADIKNNRFGKSKANEEQKKLEEKKLKYREKLPGLVIPERNLIENSYIIGVTIPRKVPDNYVTACDRCNNRFKPANPLPQGECVYHWARLPYNQTTKKRATHYPCCHQPAGESSGCTTNSYHVYKITDPNYLAGSIPFVYTPSEKTDKTLFAAGIDCEMGYTSNGMELIRVTVVDWDSGKTVLDRTVFPFGKIVDLNTNFSGVADINDGVTLDGVHFPTISFEEARKLLFGLISKSTILVGHGLENDLNTLRLIHSNVVDTAIRYPIMGGGRKYSLKYLADWYLGRTIQTGEHDSAEDALAAMDIVKENIDRSLSR